MSDNRRRSRDKKRIKRLKQEIATLEERLHCSNSEDCCRKCDVDTWRRVESLKRELAQVDHPTWSAADWEQAS